MSTPKKGSRNIIVDDICYSWRVRHKPTYTQEVQGGLMSFSVELLASPGATLIAEMSGIRPDGYVGEMAPSILPSTVEYAIRSAIAAGWKPALPGDSFLLDLK